MAMLVTKIVEWLSNDGLPTVGGGAVTFIFGLIALVFGALYNARLNRKRDDRLRAEEAKSVAAALYSEILLLRLRAAACAQLVAHMYTRNSGELDNRLLERISFADPILYQALAPKLGYLPPEIALAVTKFHADYAQVRFWLPNMMPDKTRPFSYGVSYVLRPARDAVFDVIPALRRMEGLVGIGQPAKDPDLGYAVALMESEEQSQIATA